MPFQVGVIPALRDWGLVVHEVPGCRTRGRSDFAPRGHVFHHDVIRDAPGTNDPTPGIIIHGREDLAGPLANFWLETDGDVHVVALGTANHAGVGSWNGLNENREVWGTEMNNLGTAAFPWPDVQIDAAHRLAAACAEFSHHPIANVCFHREWSPGRKPDPHTLSGTAFRRSVALAEKDGFTMADIRELQTTLRNEGDKTRETIVNQTTREIRAALAREKRTRELNGENTADVVAAIAELDAEDV